MPAAKKGAASKGIVVEFTKDRETPGTWRFAEDGDKSDHLVGTIYVKNAGLKKIGSGKPESIRVTIEEI
jgi:hypothetical protein